MLCHVKYIVLEIWCCKTVTFSSQVLACDVEDVANEILIGVEDALVVKKREYVEKSNINIQKFSNEVNLVVRYASVVNDFKKY